MGGFRLKIFLIGGGGGGGVPANQEQWSYTPVKDLHDLLAQNVR